MKPTLRRYRRRELLAAALVFVFAASSVWAGIAARSDCPWRAMVHSAWRHVRLGQNLQSVEPRMRRLQTDGSLQLWETPIGRYWMNQREADLFSVLIAEQEADIYNAASIIHPGDTVMDCGANIGVFVRKALEHRASRVIAIEPDPYGVTCMRRTFSAEIAAGRVIVYPKGVWNVESSLYLDADGDHEISASRGIQVPLTTIDHIVGELALDRVDVIKMDIEGSEKPALQGARATLRRFRPRLTIATEHRADDFSAIPALIRSIEPSYKTECETCAVQFGRLQPYTLQFVP